MELVYSAVMADQLRRGIHAYGLESFGYGNGLSPVKIQQGVIQIKKEKLKHGTSSGAADGGGDPGKGRNVQGFPPHRGG